MPTPKFPLEVEIKGVDKITAVFSKVNSRIDKVTAPVRRLQVSFIKLSEASGLPKLTAAMRGVGTAVFGVAKKVAGLALKLGGLAAAGAAGAFALVKSFANAGDQIAKTADKLGVGIEALQELRFAADRSGISVQTFDMAMQRAGRRVAEAAQGTGEAVKALAELGVSAVDAQGKARGIEDLLPELADKFAALEGPTDKMRLAMKLFDSEGVALVNMLGLGSEGVEKLRKEARELGLVMGEEAARGSESFVDAQTNLTAALTGVRNILAESLMPTVRRFTMQLTELVVKRREDIRAFAEAFVERLPGYLQQVRQGFDRLVERMRPVIEVARAVVDKFGLAKVATFALAGAVGTVLVPAVASASKSLWALNVAMTTTPVGRFILAVGALGTALYNWRSVGEWWLGFLDEMSEKFDRLIAKVRDFITLPFRKIGQISDSIGARLGEFIHGTGEETEPARPAPARLRGAIGATQIASKNENVLRVRFEGTPRNVSVDPERVEGNLDLDIGYQLAGA